MFGVGIRLICTIVVFVGTILSSFFIVSDDNCYLFFFLLT